MIASVLISFYSCLFAFAVVFVPATFAISSCKQIDVCSCETNDGKRISLWEIDSGSSTVPSFKGIKETDTRGYTFLWNPCTPFSKSGGESEKCKDVLVCQDTNNKQFYGCAEKSGTAFSVKDGKVVITYGGIKSPKGYTRRTILTLNCDKTVDKATFGAGMEETTDQVTDSSSNYTATVTTKCACPGVCTKPTRLSVGSILLIVFFPLLLLYCVAGLLLNRFHKGVNGMPEIIPNHSFWGDLPFLVKDGFVFTCSAVGHGCRSLCSKIKGESYASI